MKLSLTIGIFLLFTQYIYSNPQIGKIKKNVELIDSLIYYNQFSEADSFIQSTSELFKSKKKDSDFRFYFIKLQIQQADIFEYTYRHAQSLPIYLEALEKIEKYNYKRLQCQTLIKIAFSQEKANNYDYALDYIYQAKTICLKNDFLDLYGAIILRQAMIHRFSDHPVFKMDEKIKNNLYKMGHRSSLDSAMAYTKMAIKYSKKYQKEHDYTEAVLTKAILLSIDSLPTKEKYQNLISAIKKILRF